MIGGLTEDLILHDSEHVPACHHEIDLKSPRNKDMKTEIADN